MDIFQVHHYLKPDKVEAYKQATLENAQATAKEPGVIRFDVFQDAKDPSHFSWLEVYRNTAARDAHLQTAHFLKWKEAYRAAAARKGNGDEFTALFPAEAD